MHLNNNDEMGLETLLIPVNTMNNKIDAEMFNISITHITAKDISNISTDYPKYNQVETYNTPFITTIKSGIEVKH